MQADLLAISSLVRPASLWQASTPHCSSWQGFGLSRRRMLPAGAGRLATAAVASNKAARKTTAQRFTEDLSLSCGA